MPVHGVGRFVGLLTTYIFLRSVLLLANEIYLKQKTGGGGAGSMPTQLPHNLPTYAMGPLGLAGIGMPALPVGMAAGLRLPPPGMMVIELIDDPITIITTLRHWVKDRFASFQVGPPPPHGNGMPNLLGQSILAGLANGNVGAMAAASSLALSAMAGQAGNPPGFFGVFPPAQPAQQHHAAHNSEGIRRRINGIAAWNRLQ